MFFPKYSSGHRESDLGSFLTLTIRLSTTMKYFRTWQLRQRYNPNLLGVFSNPYFLTRRALWKAIHKYSYEVTGTVLDLGCGEQPYKSLFSATRYVGVDIPDNDRGRSQVADILYDGTRLPFLDSCFDAILCTEVLEHTRLPDAFLREARRVLRNHGTMLLTTPFAWEEHEAPNDYARFSSFGLRKLADIVGFEVVYQTKTLPSMAAVAQLLAANLFRMTRGRGVILKTLTTPLIISPISLLGLMVSGSLTKDHPLYIGNVVLLKKLPDHAEAKASAPTRESAR